MIAACTSLNWLNVNSWIWGRCICPSQTHRGEAGRSEKYDGSEMLLPSLLDHMNAVCSPGRRLKQLEARSVKRYNMSYQLMVMSIRSLNEVIFLKGCVFMGWWMRWYAYAGRQAKSHGQ